MKHILYLLILCPSLAFAQAKTYMFTDMPFELDSVTGGMVYRGVVEVPNISGDELYQRARAYLTKAFTGTGAYRLDNKANGPIIQVDDRQDGLLSGKGVMQPNQSLSAQVMSGGNYFVVPFEVRVKDGRYRYELSNIQVANGRATVNIDEALRKNPKKVQEQMAKPISEKEYQKYMKAYQPFTDFIESLKLAMSRKEPGKDF